LKRLKTHTRTLIKKYTNRLSFTKSTYTIQYNSTDTQHTRSLNKLAFTIVVVVIVIVVVVVVIVIVVVVVVVVIINELRSGQFDYQRNNSMSAENTTRCPHLHIRYNVVFSGHDKKNYTKYSNIQSNN